jgi:hypothetical protein
MLRTAFVNAPFSNYHLKPCDKVPIDLHNHFFIADWASISLANAFHAKVFIPTFGTLYWFVDHPIANFTIPPT